MTTLTAIDDDLLADTGGWLVAHRRKLDMSEAEWLGVLAEFHTLGLCELDGQGSTVSWLALQCNMARSTAHEKVKVAAELRRRPWLFDALASGRISYSAARAICRVDDYDQDLDDTFIHLATVGTIHDVERAVRHWQLVHGQGTPPPPDRAGYRMSHGFCGMGRAVIEAPNDMLDELGAVINAFVAEPDPDPGALAGDDLRPWPRRRLDALLDMARAALPHAHGGVATGADLYMMHVVVDLDRLLGEDGRATLADGTPIDNTTLARVACDCSTVAHLTRNGIDPVALGRKTRQWSTAQRRAITVRDGGLCRMPGCQSARTDIHHLWAWDGGGPTDVTNGALTCRRHHTLVHRGDVIVEGDANTTLTYRRRDGTLIGRSSPPGNPAHLFS